MNTSYFREAKNRKRSGFAGLLMLLLCVGILAFLYMMYTGSFNPFAAFQGTERDRYSDPNAYPWEEAHLFIFEALDGYDMSS
jgi:amino acid transporter